ncbi:MAG: hypothetical protein WKG00_03255 [Polyangiaceae bacterium]
MTTRLTMEDIKPHQRTLKGIAFENWSEELKQLFQSDDPKVKSLLRRENEQLVQLKHLAMGSAQKAINPASVHQNGTLSTMSVQYANDEYIGERLMPVVQADKLSGTYYVYPKRDRLGYPDDLLGPRGSANEIEESRTPDTFACKSYGLKNYVDQETIANQDAPLNEMLDMVEGVAEGIAYKREKRHAAILTNPSNFGSSLAVAAGDRWDVSGGGKIITHIQNAAASLWTGRGPGKKVGYTSLDVWNVIANNPAVKSLFQYTKDGLATPTQVARYFGLDEILVGEARDDSANSGQTAAYGRLWSNVFGVIRVATRATIRNASFGYTFRNGPVRTDQWFDLSLGRMGGYYGRVTTSEDYKIVAPDAGHLLTTIIG